MTIVHVHLYFNAADQMRWLVTLDGVTIRHNFTSRESAQRYANRVAGVGVEYA